MRQRRGRGARGFSLQELMMVVALLGVVAALASVSLRGDKRGNATAGLAREIYAQAAAARALALSSGCQVQLVLDPQDVNHDGVISLAQIASVPGVAPSAATQSETLSRIQKRGDAQISAISNQVSLSGALPAAAASADTLIFAPDGTVHLLSAPAGQLGATLYVSDSLGRYHARVAIFGGTGLSRVLLQ